MKIMCHEIRQKNSEHTYNETRSFDENSLKIYTTTTTTTSLNVSPTMFYKNIFHLRQNFFENTNLPKFKAFSKC